MKKSDILIGRIYTNGKGRERKVLDRTQDGTYRVYDGQLDSDCVLYEIVKDGSKKNLTAGKTSVMSAAAFSAWAKKEADHDE